MSKHGHSHSGGDDDDDDHGSHGHSHNGQPCHGHGAPQPKREVHGHSHNGQPCHGHGAPKGEGSAPGAHGHSHGPGGHGHSHAPVQHGHSHNGQPCHGHGENEMTEAQRKQLIMAWMQRQQQLQQQQQGQHNHSHSGGDHGHSHGDHGHSHGDHGHSHGAPRQLPPPNIKQCAVCKKEQDLLKCAGCQSVAYCSREHQKEHWKAVHKPMCAALAAARAAGEHSGGGGGENKQMQDIKVVHTIRGKALTINRMNDHGRTLCHMMQSGPIPEDWTTEACWCEEKTSKQTNVVAVSFPASALTALKAAFERDNNNASMLSPTKYELRSEPFKLAAAPEGAGVDVSSYSFELVLQVATGRNGEGMLLCLVAPKAVQKDGKIDYTSTKGVVFRGSVFMVNPEGAIEIPKFGMPQPSPAFLGVTCGCEEQSLVGVMPMSEERNAVLVYTKPEVAKAARTAAETVALTEELKDAKKAEAAAQAAVDKAWSSLGWAELKDDKFVTLVLVMEVLNTVDGDDAVEHTYFRTRQHNLHIQESPEATVPAAMTALVDDAKAAASAWACFNKNKWPVQFVAAVPNSEALKQK